MKIAFLAGKSLSFLAFNSELIKKISENGHEVVCIAPEGEDADKFKDMGARFISLHFNRNSTNPISVLKNIKVMKRIFAEGKFDAYYGFTTVGATYGSIAARLAGIKHIYVAITGAGKIVIKHTNFFEKFLSLVLRIFYSISMKGCEKVFFLNYDNMNFFIDHKIVRREQCVKTGGSGVNLEKFVPKPWRASDSFLFVGSLLKLKGIEEYMQAARIVKKIYPDTEFHIVGEIDERISAISREELDKFIADGSVIYDGYQNDVRPFLEKCSCFVLPSYTEGIPTCVIEAMATQRPIITTDAPGCRETIIDGEEGFIVPVGDAEALAQKMIYIIEHPEDAERMSRAALVRVKKEFDVKCVNRIMIDAMKLN